MKQVLQHLRSGKIEVADVPAPGVRPGHLLIATTATLLSPGTERMLVDFGRAGLMAKARAQPEKVRQVVSKLRSDGIGPTVEAVRSRLDEPLPLGYSNVGRVIAVGDGVCGFAPGQRVLSNGPHAEVVAVPANLACAIPDEVDDESAVFAVLGAIALNGVRLLEPTFGERFAVLGLGLIGLLSVQLLRANGCRVVAVDLDPERVARARAFGADVGCAAGASDPVRTALEASDGLGVDGVSIAATTKSDAVVRQAAEMCRKRGRIVLVGVTGMGLRRSDFYAKELSFRVACSYGPGRHDPDYEAKGHDYPLPFVRWTAARNFAAVLDAMASRRLEVRTLISRRLPIEQAEGAYAAMLEDRTALGIVLRYAPEDAALTRIRRISPAEPARAPLRIVSAGSVGAGQHVGRAVSSLRVGVIGAGSFARQVLLPAIQAAGARIEVIASAGGTSSLHAARRFGADEATTDVQRLLESRTLDAIFIATRHDSHASLAAAALAAGKHVFVEKPLALDEDGLARVATAYASAGDRQLLVGFNRRFAPHAVRVRELLADGKAPIAIAITVNAGELPPDHWAGDPAVGGGRVLGEACHFIDLASFLVGSPPATVYAVPLGGRGPALDSVSVQLGFAGGSIATLHYWTNGPRAYPKERVEVFSAGRALAIENWRSLRRFDWPGAPRLWMRQDKGHRTEVARFLTSIAAGEAPLVPFEETARIARAIFACVRSAREGACIDLEAMEAIGGMRGAGSPVPSPRALAPAEPRAVLDGGAPAR